MERVQRELQRHLSAIMANDLKDPRLSRLLALTKTAISADLRVLKCYVTVPATANEQRAVIKTLQRARSYFRKLLASRTDLRVVPELRFFLDDTPERAERIEKILAEVAPGGTGNEAGKVASS